MLRFKYMTNAIGHSANTLTANRSGVREGYKNILRLRCSGRFLNNISLPAFIQTIWKNITQTFVIARPGNSSTWSLDKPIFSTPRARGNIGENIMNC